jgi:translation initiation factor IF-3
VKSEVKGIRITFRASPHDLEIRAAQADAFLAEGHTVRIEMPLRGREKGKEWFAKERMKGFLSLLTTPFRIQQDVRPAGRGIEMIIVRDKSKPAQQKNASPPNAAPS